MLYGYLFVNGLMKNAMFVRMFDRVKAGKMFKLPAMPECRSTINDTTHTQLSV